MRLTQALRLDRSARLALVGAGGKTAALFTLGRQLSQPASAWGEQPVPARPAVNLVPAARKTPHLHKRCSWLRPPTWQPISSSGDHHFTLLYEADLDEFEDEMPAVCCFLPARREMMGVRPACLNG
jgi:hypothetical protein